MDPGLETGEEEADIGGKTLVFAPASEQACHNVSVPLFAAKYKKTIVFVRFICVIWKGLSCWTGHSVR